MKTILFCPVRERPDVLTLSLESHRRLEGISERWYLNDCDDPESHRLLAEEGVQILYPDGTSTRHPKWHWREYATEKTGYENHQWTATLMNRMTQLRDIGLHEFHNGLSDDSRDDRILILDSDVIPHPKTVERLISLDLPVVSTVYWSQWPVTNDICECGHARMFHYDPPLQVAASEWRSCLSCTGCKGMNLGRTPWLPNVWDFHNYQFSSVESILRLRTPGTYPVGGLGAITLIRRDAIEKGARYEPIPGIADYPGEDRHFSIRCAAAGIPLHVDTMYPAFHIYRPDEQLNEAREWFENGCGEHYFNSWFLTPEWEKQIRSNLG
jgi:cellulose synthase/poly-beta-1,6-N-acetylglucosamine synthase-like glycosyltransferase